MTNERDRSPAAGGVSNPTNGVPWHTVTAPRSDGQPEWELFLRESPTEPLRHAGSVTAPDPEAAHERATGLFPEATTVWCCPATEVSRVTTRGLGAGYRNEAEAGGEVA